MWKAWNQMLMLMINWIMTTISRDLKKINLFRFKEQFYTIELSLLFCFVSSTLEQVLRRRIWTLFTEVSCGTLIILRSTSMKQNVEIVEYISHVPNRRKKTNKLRHFWQTIENVGCLTHLFSTICQSFCKLLLIEKVTTVILWTRKPEFGKFALILENFTRDQKYFTKVPFVTNSKSVSHIAYFQELF